jgi:hypothetical protein
MVAVTVSDPPKVTKPPAESESVVVVEAVATVREVVDEVVDE